MPSLKNQFQTQLKKITDRPGLNKILQNTGWLFADRVLRMGLAFVVTIWLARYLGPEQFGLLNFAMAFVALFGAIATVGLNSVVVRDLVKFPEKTSSILSTSISLQILGGLITFSLIVLAIHFLKPEDALARAIAIILGLSMVVKFSETIKYWYESQVQSKFVVWAESAVLVLFAAIKILLILQQAPLISFAWAIFAETVVLAIALIILYSIQSKTSKIWQPQLCQAKTLLRESWPLILSGLSVMVYMRIDQVMLGQMLNNEAVGIYSAAVKISEMWYFVPIAIVASVYPAIISSKEKSESLYQQRMQNLYDLMVYISVFVALIVTFSADWIVISLFGDAYSESGFVLAVHIWIGLFVSLGVASSKWFLLENLSKLIFYRTLYGALLNVLLNLVLIPSFGIKGCLIATLISYSFAALWFDAFAKKTRKAFVMKIRALIFRSLYAA
ncbi:MULTISPECIES: flippase [unclassified Methylophaga]|jgi:PST family polysaccharide transporter|uniref:flippase n=1 Tax=unclassified Methylophaga TaxID=2629249 RepID=UPI000C95F418|nr:MULTISPECIES: flippase [unclassified Methylophaga]MAL49845.1 O-unit flippase [Methylophaga sp.]MAM28211.1 O-unit flippase [Flavobacteriaceae bacterium]HCC80515.1 flippase [Methylophaga sp.]|tara:strand:+ start:1153 stop:2487 length:1335 start_codon:yes stop_codon:yes gene_type:complete